MKKFITLTFLTLIITTKVSAKDSSVFEMINFQKLIQSIDLGVGVQSYNFPLYFSEYNGRAYIGDEEDSLSGWTHAFLLEVDTEVRNSDLDKTTKVGLQILPANVRIRILPYKGMPLDVDVARLAIAKILLPHGFSIFAPGVDVRPRGSDELTAKALDRFDRNGSGESTIVEFNPLAIEIVRLSWEKNVVDNEILTLNIETHLSAGVLIDQEMYGDGRYIGYKYGFFSTGITVRADILDIFFLEAGHHLEAHIDQNDVEYNEIYTEFSFGVGVHLNKNLDLKMEFSKTPNMDTKFGRFMFVLEGNLGSSKIMKQRKKALKRDQD
ncbi:MAG: hypothetical protein HOE90_00255 [Bacteriovoracaceae bacterium]|nr:hypothetical protein [Bacteriovoracaceae bacterium]